MPIITGSITPHGALLDLFVRVSKNRQEKLEKLSLPIPPPVPVRAIIDTGSSVTGFHADVFTALQIQPVQSGPLLTPSTRPEDPYLAKYYDIRVVLVSGTDQYVFPPVLAIEAQSFDPTHPDRLLGLIGRDILDRCIFDYFGPQQEFRLAF